MLTTLWRIALVILLFYHDMLTSLLVLVLCHRTGLKLMNSCIGNHGLSIQLYHIYETWHLLLGCVFESVGAQHHSNVRSSPGRQLLRLVHGVN